MRNWTIRVLGAAVLGLLTIFCLGLKAPIITFLMLGVVVGAMLALVFEKWTSHPKNPG